MWRLSRAGFSVRPPKIWPWGRAVLALVIAVGISACEGEDFQAQVAAAEEAGDYNTLVTLWGDRADTDDVEAILQVGALYGAGPDSVQNFSAAASSYRRGVALGDTTSMIRLGALYERGLGVERDPQRALVLFTQASEQGNPIGDYRVARLFDGTMLGPADYTKAMEWYEIAAEQGVIEAQVELANHHFAGLFMPRDTDKAAKWFREAAEHGHAGSQFRMGFLYRTGNSVPKDPIIAYAWLRIAAARDVAPAVTHLTEVGDELDPESLARAKALSQEYWELYVAPFLDGV
jgi:TPR repeat protein